MPDATATNKKPSHHLTLSDGVTTYGFVVCDGRGNDDLRQFTKTPQRRTGLRTVQGDTKHSDFELPYTNVAQDDWSLGRGKLDEASGRYWHGFMTNAMHEGKVFLAPQPGIATGTATGLRLQNIDLFGNTTFQGLYGDTEYLARQFTPAANYSADYATLWVKKVGTPNGNITVELWTDDGADDPNAIIGSITATDNNALTWISQMIKFDWTGTTALVSGTKYFIVIYGHASDDATNHWAVGVNSTVGSDVVRDSADGSTWATATVSPYFRVVEADAPFDAHFFEYRGQAYLATAPDAGGAGKLYINGDRGRALGAGQSSTTLQDTAKSWGTNEWAGKVVKIIAGTGRGQYLPIASNDGDTLTITGSFDITPITADSEYVILGADYWPEITGHGLTKPVTDVLVSNGVVRFAQGDGTNIRRMVHAAPNSYTYADDGTNQADFLEKVYEPGGGQIWKANNVDNGDTTIAKATPAGDSNLSFGTAIPVGDQEFLITGLERYEDPENLWVFKDGEAPFRIVGDEPQQIPLREMESVRSDNNGRAHTVGGVYLYFSLLRGAQRYFNQNLDNWGPDIDDGLQAGYQGPVSYLKSYPGRVYGAVQGEDWNTSSFSSIQVNNGSGWHNFFRSFLAGPKIRSLYFQTIPGSNLDRLWFSEGGDIGWLGMPSETLDPERDSSYKYFHEGMLQTSWYYLGLRDIEKTFNSIKVAAENLSSNNQYIDVRYELDDTGTPVDISGSIDTAPYEELDISTSSSQITGKRIQFTFIFRTTDETKTPTMKASVLEAVAHLPTKFRYQMQVRIGDYDVGLDGPADTNTAQTIITQLETWANDGTQLTQRENFGSFDNKAVVLDPAVIKPLVKRHEDNTEITIAQMSTIEL